MAKKQVFGDEAKTLKSAHRKMAKVIISTKNARGQFSYKERMIDQDSVSDFIKKNKA